MAILIPLLLCILLLLPPSEQQGTKPLTALQLRDLLHTVRGDDRRIVRWDATDYTARQQVNGGCDSLGDALQTIIEKASEEDTSASDDNNEEIVRLAFEYATFCITDNLAHRAQMTKYSPGIYQSIVHYVSSTNQHTSATASHLIYIASFSNTDNHQGFFQAGAVSALSNVIKTGEQSGLPVQVMWASAALQNLAASYCQTKDDGRCYWFWPQQKNNVAVKIDPDSLPLLSDGDRVRREIANDTDLINKLVQYACQRPVKGRMTRTNPYPGENAQVGVHDESPNLVAWAAAGALKNIALLSQAAPLIEPALPCLCRLAHSHDWLEENKGQGAIEHLRRDDPCWFQKKDGRPSLCVDRVFYDDEHYTCTDYGEATREECTTMDSNGATANDACCGCGGGDYETVSSRDEEL